MADDLTQETFLRAIRSIRQFEGRSTAMTWLLAIGRRVVADHYRRSVRNPILIDPETLMDSHEGYAGMEGLVEVATVLQDLSLERREALVLTQLLGLSYTEAATVCGVAVGTIRSRVARARSELAELLDPPTS